MAGDTDVLEAIVAPTQGIVAGAAGPLLHDYGPNLRIHIGSGGTADAPINEAGLSETERLGLQAFRARLSAAFSSAKAQRPYADLAWGAPGAPSSIHPDPKQVIIRGAPVVPDPGEVDEAPEAKRLAGRVAVGLVMVSGPGSLALTPTQQVKIVAEIQNGLTWLGAQSPAKDVTWVHDNQVVEVTVPDRTALPPPGSDPYEHYEAPWRDAALVKLGLPKGGNGIKKFIKNLKAATKANAAYLILFTLYRLNHFAYCSGSYLTMHYDNDGWGPDNIDRVVAHETGHIFGCPDEYAESGCDCGGSWGHFGHPNLNCEACAPGGGVDCIMKRNSWAMCSETPFHLGFQMD